MAGGWLFDCILGISCKVPHVARDQNRNHSLNCSSLPTIQYPEASGLANSRLYHISGHCEQPSRAPGRIGHYSRLWHWEGNSGCCLLVCSFPQISALPAKSAHHETSSKWQFIDVRDNISALTLMLLCERVLRLSTIHCADLTRLPDYLSQNSQCSSKCNVLTHKK